MTKSCHGDLINKMRELAARPQGVSRKEASEILKRPVNTPSGYIYYMIRNGEIVCAGARGSYRYFKDRDAAAIYDKKDKASAIVRMAQTKILKRARHAERERERRAAASANPNKVAKKRIREKKITDQIPKRQNISLETTQQGLDKKRQHLAATIVWPDHVKVQVYKTKPDMRFKADPSYRGSFSKEWEERRAA